MATNTSVETPADARPTASLRVAQARPFAPAASCNRAICVDLCVLMCGRSLTARWSHSDCISEMFSAMTAVSTRRNGVAARALAKTTSLPQESDLSTFGDYANRLSDVAITPRSTAFWERSRVKVLNG